MQESLLFLKPSDIIPYKNNAKVHPQQQIEAIIKSIKEFGFTNPVLIDESYNCIAGHGRLLAAIEMGMTEVPCRIIKGLNEEQRKALILADNKIAEMAGWDYDLLNIELDSIKDIDMSDFGFELEFDFNDQEQEQSQEVEEVDIPDKPNEAIVKTGEIWQLGTHRLMCGDSTNKEDIKLLLDGLCVY